MEDRDLRKLSRAELLELLISQTQRVEELEDQLAEAQWKIVVQHLVCYKIRRFYL